MKMFSGKRAISLIELMLTVLILSIGLVLIIRSFFTVIGALNYAQNKISALQLLDSKMAEIREASLLGEDVLEKETEEYIDINNRNFYYKTEFFSVSDEKEEEIENLKKIVFLVKWQEAGIEKEAKAVSYIKIGDDEE